MCTRVDIFNYVGIIKSIIVNFFFFGVFCRFSSGNTSNVGVLTLSVENILPENGIFSL